MDQSRLSFLALQYVSGIGNHLIRQLISYCGSPEKVFRTPRGKLLQIPGIGQVTADAIVAGAPFERAEQELQRAHQLDVQLLTYLDKAFPSRLRHQPDAPTLLYTRGHMNLEQSKVVGVVGTRQATTYGKDLVEQLVEALIPHHVLLVSGLAYGIDIHAHKQALRAGLPTVAVLGSGVDVIYPGAHRDTAMKMLEHGGLISENPLGTKPDSHLFPSRNRIIAGLCDALVVVEAADRGGALITAEVANSYNKDVFAFPGRIGDSFSMGCNNLIKTNRAHLLTSVRDLEYIMNWQPNDVATPPTVYALEHLDESEQAVMRVLIENKQLAIDELSVRVNMSVSQLASALLQLEFQGMVQALPGKQYKLVTR